MRDPKINLTSSLRGKLSKNGTPNVESTNAGLSARSTSLLCALTVVGTVVDLNALALDLPPLFLFTLLVSVTPLFIPLDDLPHPSD